MCMFDYFDGNEFGGHRECKARKQHTCGECGRKIEIGEVYRYAAGKADGEFWQAKQCSHCQVPAEWLRTNCRGFLYEAVIEDFSEHADGTYMMMRIVVGAKRGWRSFSGDGLLPVPAYPPNP